MNDSDTLNDMLDFLCLISHSCCSILYPLFLLTSYDVSSSDSDKKRYVGTSSVPFDQVDQATWNQKILDEQNKKQTREAPIVQIQTKKQ